MKKNHNIVNISIPSSSVYMGVVVQDKLMVYEQEDVAYALAMGHGLMKKHLYLRIHK